MTVNTKPPSSAAIAKASSSAKVNTVSSDKGYILKIRDITQTLLQQHFPELNAAPNVLYVAMATWGLESNFQLLRPIGVDKALISTHRAKNPPNLSKSFLGKGYYFTRVIRNLVESPTVSTQTINNIKQGLYAQGISALMGAYQVKGTLTYDEIVKPFEALAYQYGLVVEPGQSIEAVYTNDDAGITKSIFGGLLIYNARYKAYRKKNPPAEALRLASISYVGKGTVLDNNGYSPLTRGQTISSGKGSNSREYSILAQLSGIGLSADGFVQRTGSVVYSYPQAAVGVKGTATNTETRVASNDNQAPPDDLPGCS